MNIVNALEKGYGYAHKKVVGSKYWVQRVGDLYYVNLRHRSGIRKEVDTKVEAHTVARRYGSEGWEPGM